MIAHRALAFPPIKRLHLLHTLTLFPLATIASHNCPPLLPHIAHFLLNKPIVTHPFSVGFTVNYTTLSDC
jgi:hypothetical protein